MNEPGRSAAIGRWGETAAGEYLLGIGHRILQKNYKRHTGEVDIISMDGDCIVCTEVKTWFGAQQDDLSRALSPSKQRRVARTAQMFLLENGQYRESPVRFDVVCIGPKTGLSHYTDAFQGAE